MNFTYEFNKKYNGFIIYDNKMEVSYARLIIIYNFSIEKTILITEGAKYIDTYYKYPFLYNSNTDKPLVFLSKEDSELFIKKLESELLLMILSGKSEELTVSQMIKLL